MARGGAASRRTLALALAIALPTILLGAGWTAASLQARASAEGEREAVLARTAAVVRGAVDESLEELRRREDARPFYLYNAFFSPPDVVALNDPIAPSPLAADPEDPRVVGYFQVEPDGVVRTPYSTEPDGVDTARAERVVGLVRSEEFARLRDLSSGTDEERVAAAEPSPSGSSSSSPSDWLLSRLSPSAEPDEPSARPAPEPRPTRRRSRREPPSAPAPLPAAPAPDAGAAQAELAPQGPLTVALNPWAVEVGNDLQLAQAGSPEANMRVQQRGRAAPRTRRRTVPWEEMQAGAPGSEGSAGARQAVRQQAEPAPRQEAVPQVEPAPRQEAVPQVEPAPRQEAVPQVEPALRQEAVPQVEPTAQAAAVPQAGSPTPRRGAPSSVAGTPGAPSTDRTSRPRRRATSRRVPAGPEPGERPSPAPALPQPSLPAEVEVGYTPMAWRTAGDELVLHRVVSHQGVGVVQGVILDREHLLHEWIPSLVERHAVAGAQPRVVASGGGEECALRRPASSVVEGVELCYSAAAVTGVAGQLRDDLHLQLAALAGLVLIVTLAGVFMHRTARRAEELSSQKSAFVSTVSHELRTPLTTIRMHAEMLREGMVPEGKQERFHEQMVQEAVRLSRLVENVLELSRLEEGRRVLDLGEGDLAAHVDRVLEEQRTFVEAKGFTVVGPDGDHPVAARYDDQAVSQIVSNLVDNAVKYAAAGEPRTIEVHVDRAGDDATIRVLDKGPGIPAAERERVFERFHRAVGATAEQAPGTGIGLALVRELARAHGGDAEALPREGGGCEILVTLPTAT